MNEVYRKKIEEAIFQSPLALLAINDQEVIDYVEQLLPYSVGFEIECDLAVDDKVKEEWNKNYDKFTKTLAEHNTAFREIPDIMSVDNGSGEQRYRIPFGLRGIICLYNISELLKLRSRLNLGSGIHYHIDMTESYHLVDPLISYSKVPVAWVVETLKELDTWGYKGFYNSRGIQAAGEQSLRGLWVRWQHEFKTAEFRCGEMTFEYSELLKCMVSASNCIRKLKIEVMGKESYDTFIKNRKREPIDVSKVLTYLKSYRASEPVKRFEALKAKEIELNKKLADLKTMQAPARATDQMKAIIEARTKKLGQ